MVKMLENLAKKKGGSKKLLEKHKLPRRSRLLALLDRLSNTLVSQDGELIKVRKLVFFKDPSAIKEVRKYNARFQRVIPHQIRRIERLLKKEELKANKAAKAKK